MFYLDRQQAGRMLAQSLRFLRGKQAIVLALPRGGVVLGAEIAHILKAPLGVVLVKKISHPSSLEFAIGAKAEDDPVIYNEQNAFGVLDDWRREEEKRATRRIHTQRQLYDTPKLELRNKTVVLVDDGIATGLTMLAAVSHARHEQASRIIIAVPVASSEAIDMLEKVADEIIVLDKPTTQFSTVGNYYRNFDQVEDDEVKALLKEANAYVYS